jgi:hypothetical protein
MEEVLPLYFPVFVMEEMVVIEPPTFLCHWTEVTGKLTNTGISTDILLRKNFSIDFRKMV